MNKLDDQLPELMTRATDGLEPESVDLVERSVAQGVRLRRRRSAAAGVAAGGAVLVTMGLVVAGVQHFDQRGGSQPLVAGPPVASKPTSAPSGLPSADPTKKPKPGGPTLKTLQSLLKGPGRTLSAPASWGGEDEGFFAASTVVDDGKGKSQVQVLTQRMLLPGPPTCKDVPGCTKRPDGSTIRSQQLGHERDGVLSNFVEITWKDGRFIGLTSYNAVSEKDSKPTRAKPFLTVAQLTELAGSKQWKYPAQASK